MKHRRLQGLRRIENGLAERYATLNDAEVDGHQPKPVEKVRLVDIRK